MHNIKSDEKLNPELKKEIGTLRGMINSGKDTPRFKKVLSNEHPRVIITDTETGKTAEVSLYAASKVMETLSILFE